MKTFSRSYDTHGQATQVIADLKAAGISDSQISMLANKHVSEQYDNVGEYSDAASGAGLGAAIGGAGGLLTGLGIVAIPGVGPVVAAGWLASTVAGMIAGGAAGGVVGALVDAGVSKEHADVYSESIRRGGTLVTVRAEDSEAATVEAVLNSHEPMDPVTRRDEYASTGWKGYDPKAAPYDLTDAERERIRTPYCGV